MEGFDVLSNWEVANEDNLNKIVSSSSIDKEFDLDSVSVENCICLIKNGSCESKSKPELYIHSNLGLRQIYILSEGSLIEIFGNHNEYLFTCESDFIDDWGGMAVYQAKIILPNLHFCNLKFIRIKELTRLWIYHIQLTTADFEESSNHNLINIENVNKLINTSNHELSKRAENFKKFFEIYANNASQFKDVSKQFVNFDNLLKYADSKCILGLVNGANKPGQSSSTSIQGEVESNSVSLPVSNSNNKTEFNPSEKDELQKYIDKKLNDLREDILRHVDFKLNQFFEENNSKLNKILGLLEDLSNKSS